MPVTRKFNPRSCASLVSLIKRGLVEGGCEALALCHYWRTTGGRRLTSSILKEAYRNEHSTQHHSALALAFQPTAELTIRGGGMPYSNLALDADRENGPAARSFAADAHDWIMVRIKRSYRIQVCGTKMRPNGELPSDPKRQTGTVQTLKLCKKPLSQVIVAPRAQASRRCETQATLGGKPPSFATVSVP